MKQALHIFRKDTRRLWPVILIVCLLFAVNATLEVRPIARHDNLTPLLYLLLPLGIWFLIAQAIFQESLPGTKQFWLTRPYSRASLLTAKLIFALAYITIPLILSDCFILTTQGFEVLSVIPRLLVRQALLAAIFILPAFVIASVTSGISQFLLAIFGLMLLVVLESGGLNYFMHTNFILGAEGASQMTTLVVIAAIALVIWQFKSRSTRYGQFILFASLTAFLPGAICLQMFANRTQRQPQLPPPPPGVTAHFADDHNRQVPPEDAWRHPASGLVLLRIPLTISGMNSDNLLRGNTMPPVVVGNWRLFGSIERLDKQYWLILNTPNEAYELLKHTPQPLQLNLHLNIVTDQIQFRHPINQIKEQQFTIPNLGICYLYHQNDSDLHIRTGLAPHPETDIALQSDPTRHWIMEIPQIDIPLGFSPTTNTTGRFTLSPNTTNSDLIFIPRHKLAEFQQTLTLPALDLTHYAIEQ